MLEKPANLIRSLFKGNVKQGVVSTETNNKQETSLGKPLEEMGDKQLGEAISSRRYAYQHDPIIEGDEHNSWAREQAYIDAIGEAKRRGMENPKGPWKEFVHADKFGVRQRPTI